MAERAPTRPLRVALLAPPGMLRDRLAADLANSPQVDSCEAVGCLADGAEVDTAVYLPAVHRDRLDPDLIAAEEVFRGLREAGARHWVVISSAAVHEPSWRHLGLVPEEPLARARRGNRVARDWRVFESLARAYLPPSASATVLRPAALATPDGHDFWSRLFQGRWALSAPGFDPPLQLLAPEDLSWAVRRVVEEMAEGVFHVAPAGAVALHLALQEAGVRRLPVPLWLRRPFRRTDELEYLRHPWTVSGDRIRERLGCQPRQPSLRAAAALRAGKKPRRVVPPAEPDDFGMDRDYVNRTGGTLRAFLHDRYWRVEWQGLEHVPKRGRAVLAGIHRGHQPWDGVMTVHLIARELGRVPRFLIHPTLIKFPVLAPFMMRLGGLPACQRNADRILGCDRLLAIYPEGIQGAFTRYRNAYKLRRFGRDEFVRIALRNRAPIVPFVTVGSAEIFPILAKIHWRRWQRWSEWPCLPITPTMGLVPLPSKWHTLFLEPLRVEERFAPEAADDPAIVKELSLEVRRRMEDAIADLLSRRRSIFWGSIFNDERVPEALGEKPA